jgi:hypothetical protein
MNVHRLPSRPAPKLDETIKALREYDTYPEPDEQLSAEAGDLLAAAEWVSETHVGDPRERPAGTFGPCRDCGHPWPCPAWDDIRTLTLSWLIRASTPALAVSRRTNTDFDLRRRPA